MKNRLLLIAALICLFATGSAQGWSEAYDKALTSVAEQNWQAARTAFQESIALRPEDQSSPTTLPGPVTEPNRWRDGAPYSPNFGTAYSAYRLAGTATGEERTQWYKTAVGEFETLLAKNQNSKHAFFFLKTIYSRILDTQNSQTLNARLSALGDRVKWRIDTEMLAPEENAAVETMFRPIGSSRPQQAGSTTTPTKNIIKATDLNTGTPETRIGGTGDVPVIPTKYALVIGNSESMMADQKLSFAASDALIIHNSLIENAGYAKENVDMVVNATADQMLASAKALAERMPQDATLFIYFTGAGFNIGGKDYYGGIDADSVQDSAHMLQVSELYGLFLAKGASIFSFTQAHRPNNAGLYFGKETPMFGRIAQAHATIPGSTVNSLVTQGRDIGAYTLAFTEILSDIRSNRIPVTEFVWLVFYNMRRGGGPQTPTLPVLIVLPADARF